MKNLLILFWLISIRSITDVIAHRVLVEEDIWEIYRQYVEPNNNEEYRFRYVPLPMEKNTLLWEWENKDFPRVIALLEFERFINANNISCEKGLAFNGLDPEWNYLKARSIKQIDYYMDPDKHDLHKLELEEKDFDFVMLNQTLEHVYNPIRCLENIYQHMREGGILYLNVPSNNIPHSTPFHYYTGFTPVGVGAVVRAAGFKILSVGQWGNVEYLHTLFNTKAWPDYRQLHNPGLNEMCCPIIVWVFAIKNCTS